MVVSPSNNAAGVMGTIRGDDGNTLKMQVDEHVRVQAGVDGCKQVQVGTHCHICISPTK